MTLTSTDLRPSRTKVGRITSLDGVRGLFLCLSVTSASLLPPRPQAFKHAPWIGVHLEDTIFPLFVILSGCGLAFAYRNAVGWGATARRSVVLLVCGLVYNMVEAQSVDLNTLRWAGPLQVYAVLVLVIGVLHRWARTPRAWMQVTAVVAVLQAAFLASWQSTCPGDRLSPTCNPSDVIDRAVLGTSHMYAQGLLGHDPEGLVSIVGALLTACVGCTAGHLALAGRGSWHGPARLVAWAVVVFTAGAAAGLVLPAMKRLWTTPFALGVGAIGVVMLAVGMVVLDLGVRPGSPRTILAWPFVAMGRNSLLVYFGSHLLMLVLTAHGGTRPWAGRVAGAVDVVGHPRVSLIVAMVLGWAAVAAVLHSRRIYLRP